MSDITSQESRSAPGGSSADPFARLATVKPDVHVHGGTETDEGPAIVCATEARGQPKNLDLRINEIRIGVGNAIPLWESGVTLHWRFDPVSFSTLVDPDAAKARIRMLFASALAMWGDAAPVDFAERDRSWDFEIVLLDGDNCNPAGCVLASAFFPDAGQHRLRIYPSMLRQSEREQVETMVHELGHVFGLRHFFANVSETQLPSEVFGTDSRFSIMNYGADSYVTAADRTDLTELYSRARSRRLVAVNGTPIKLVRPFSASVR
jgi:hypothetical protein